ncbi:hypothetical protein X975_13143, partial [Stegodyphus mimosarum]
MPLCSRVGHFSSNCHSPLSALSVITVVSGSLEAFSPRNVHQTSTLRGDELFKRHVKVTAEQLLTTGGSTMCSIV